MVATARTIKKQYPDAKVVFIGPCASKKLEASRTDVRSDVDFVITFEELAGMLRRRESIRLSAREILPSTMQRQQDVDMLWQEAFPALLKPASMSIIRR